MERQERNHFKLKHVSRMSGDVTDALRYDGNDRGQ